VYPGVYQEAPLTVPTGVVLWGHGAVSNSIETTDDTGAVVTLAAGAEINGFMLSGGSNGGVGLLANAAGTALARALVIRDCTTGVRATGAGVTMFCALCEIEREAGEVLTTGAEALAGGRLELISPHIEAEAGALITTGARADGANSVLHLYSLDITWCTSATLSANSGMLMALGGVIENCANMFRINAGTLHAHGVASEMITQYGLWIEILAGSVFRGSGNGIRSDQINVPAGADIVSAQLSDFAGDNAQMVIGELAVGLPGLPSELVVGEGDSHVRGMSVLRNTNGEAGVWSDITTEMASASGSTAVAFPGVGAANCMYIGGDAIFPGAKIRTTVAIVLGAGGSIVWEYWNGAAWTTFRLMTADEATPYNSYAEDTFGRINFEQVRFNPDDMTGWATRALNGTTKYWVRCRVAVGITTAPTLEQIKLHTNRTEINGDGYVEHYGTGEQQRVIPWHQKLLDNFVGGGAPGNQALALTANITISAQSNLFANNQLEGMGGVFTVPDGLDTSRDVTLRWTWIPLVAGAGAAVEFEGHFGQIEIGDIINGGVGDTAWNEIVNTNALAQNELAQTDTEFDVSDLVPGELLAFSLSRDAQAGNPDDTLAGNVALVTVELQGWFWR
jgi:hypothetical protein